MQLGAVLRAVISQRLVPKADARGRVAAVEILIATTRVRELVEDKDRTKEIPDAIAQGHLTYGMQTFDQSLMGLLKQSIISYDEALRQATNRDDFALRVSGISATSDSKWDDFEGKSHSSGAAAAAAARPPPQPLTAAPRAAPSQPQPQGTVSFAPTQVSPMPRPPPAAAPAAVPKPVPSGTQPGSPDDDFQIERF